MVKSLLESPLVYGFSQFLWYRSGRQNEYVSEYVRPRPGDRILDIGCGVGAVAQYFPDVVYHGFDSNPAYVKYARTKFGERAEFTHGIVGEDVFVEPESYDIAMANGVLHHLDDAEVIHLLTLARSALKPGGRFVTRDGCYEDGQSRFVRLLLDNDRGRYVRTEASYRRLLSQAFVVSRCVIRRDMLRLPYSLIIFECTKPA